MAKLIIIGNGFDLAHKIPTSYNDFRKYLIAKYLEAYQNRNRIIDISEIKDLECISVELLIYALDHVNGEDWSNFEASLSHINFEDKFPRHEHREDPEEDNSSAAEYLMYIMALTEVFGRCVSLWKSLLSAWIKEIERSIENYVYKPLDTIQELLKCDAKIMTFNYTKTIQILYGKSGIKHIHNRVGQELIFGHSNIDSTYQEDCYNSLNSNFLDDIIKMLYKDTRKQIAKYSDFFKKIDSSINEVYSYGFSYGPSDIPYIKLIISRIAEDVAWYFTKFDSQNKEFMRRTKIKLRRLGFKGQFSVGEY
ncbi:MAG: bacteriophage abortive infection AbiH family protein [Lachnospiraceae bacterium]|nr:bacteriophage abortive infection AbiH family protein [Lachnospiraceae bacterium]